MQSVLLAFSLLGIIISGLMGILSLLMGGIGVHYPKQDRRSLLTFGTVCMLIALGCLALWVVAPHLPE